MARDKIREEIKKEIDKEFDDLWDNIDRYTKGHSDYWRKMKLRLKEGIKEIIDGRKPTKRWRI